MSDADAILTRLRHALQALALPADVQVKLLPDFVVEMDELALAFENWLRSVEADGGVRLKRGQRAALRRVEAALDAMSGQANAGLWTRRALRDAEPWARLRGVAAEALEAFGWKVETPPAILLEYIEW